VKNRIGRGKSTSLNCAFFDRCGGIEPSRHAPHVEMRSPLLRVRGGPKPDRAIAGYATAVSLPTPEAPRRDQPKGRYGRAMEVQNVRVLR
jgi:hypothetical protein